MSDATAPYPPSWVNRLLAWIDASTWPWAPDTLRGFVTAIVLPIGLWLVYRLLCQVVL